MVGSFGRGKDIVICNVPEVASMNFSKSEKTLMVTKANALVGRPRRLFQIPVKHEVSGAPMEPPFPAGTDLSLFAMGCFWGAERKFWQVPGVVSTQAGYAGGFTANPYYEEVCTG